VAALANTQNGGKPLQFYFGEQRISNIYLISPALHLQRNHKLQFTRFSTHKPLPFFLSSAFSSSTQPPPIHINTKIHMLPSTQTTRKPVYKTAHPSVLLETQLPIFQILPFSPVKTQTTLHVLTVNTVELVVSRDSSSRVSGSIPIASKNFWPPCP